MPSTTPNPKRPNTAAIYCRISEDREGEGLGVERQEADCRALAQRIGATVVQVYIDNDASASTRSKKPRPAYKEMLAAAEMGQFGCIIAYSNSRLTRRPAELEALVDLNHRTGIEIKTVVSGSYNLATADGRMQARLVGSIDAAEAERTAERVTRAARQAAEAGKWHGGSRPFGYESDGVTVRFDEASALRDSYQKVLAGASLASIARTWNELGMRTGRMRQPWKNSSVREVLTSARYAGLRSYRGEIVGAAEWPAIVDREKWEAVRTILADPARGFGPKSARRLLSGLAMCAKCGETVHLSGGSAAKPVYRCRSGEHVARQALPIEEYVSSVIVGRLSLDDAAALFTDQQPVVDEGLRQEAQTLRARLDDLALAFADGELTAEQLRVASSRIRGNLDRVEGELITALRVSPLAQFAGRDPGEVWEEMDVDMQRAVIDRLAEVRIGPAVRGSNRFNPDSVSVEWR